MKKKYLSLTKQLEILGFQLLTLGLCVQPVLCAGPVYIPGYYGSASAVLPQPAATTLPSGATIIDGVNNIATSGSSMTVHQGKPRAVIHWQNFDIGSQATVNFDQQDSSWKALNRVTGDGYSQIFGTLTAKGQVYILNQNGILFGPGSQINVHSLTASALNLKDEDFLNLPSFAQGGKETYTYSSAYPLDATVANHGTINAGDLGSVFLIGPQVENSGTIIARGGDVGLLAGDLVEIEQLPSTQLLINTKSGYTPGKTTNFANGAILTRQGWSGMYGSIVNQEGLIRAVTAFENNGRIVLQATNRLSTGATSRTETPVDDSGERRIVDADTFKKGTIDIRANIGPIEHFGHISSPGGKVTLTSGDRVSLEDGSTIDVGGSWVGLTANDRIIEVQLNSQELRDSFVHKDGPLKGQTVQVDVITGIPHADISGYLKSMAKSVPELTTTGGEILLKSTGSGIIVKQGATLDFSGGGLTYGKGFFENTKVRVGKKIYNLEDLPAGVPVDEVLGSFSKEHKRYGIINTWQGQYYGGSTPYRSPLPAFSQGANGGKLTFRSRKVDLDGIINGSVLRGIYQNSLEDSTDDNGNLNAIGRRIPRGGTLEIGEPPGVTDFVDLLTNTIVIYDEIAPTSASATKISAETINEAGLGSLNLFANNTIRIEENAHLTLAELGSLDFAAANIEHLGAIDIPSGAVNLTLRRTPTSSPQNRIILTNNSVIDVSGKRQDNSVNQFGRPVQPAINFGGSVTLFDNNAQNYGEVILTSGSLINVSGGYTVNADNSITEGKAGKISLKGNTVLPDGQLVGLALEGSEGGTLSIHADEVTISPNDPTTLPRFFSADDQLPISLQHHLVLTDTQFANSGFSHIDLKSEGNLLVEKGVSISPSSARLAKPSLTPTGYQLETNNTVTARPEDFGPSSLALAAGQRIYTDRQGSVTIAESSFLSVAPTGGKISLTGNEVNLAGSVKAQGGDIALSATNGNLTLASGATVDASGTTLPDPKHSVPRLPPNNSVVDGGSVTLSAGRDVVLNPGSLVDVSGSESVTNWAIGKNGKIIGATTASAAGSVNIGFRRNLINDGELRGASLFPWLPGGSLTIAKTDLNTLTLKEEVFGDWVKSGFDNFTFSSIEGINFVESVLDFDEIVTFKANRGLVLNCSALIGSTGQEIEFSGSWVRLSNIDLGLNTGINVERVFTNVQQGSAKLALSGDFIDIQGNVALSGFATTTVSSANDLRLYDYYYNLTYPKGWSGALRSAGDLNLQAAAIYPGMHHATYSLENIHNIYPTSFTISSGLSNVTGNFAPGKGGKITLLAPSQPMHRNVYSAGGKLTLLANDIENNGILTAPMGEIVLAAEDHITLGDNSLLSTHSTAMTLYGMLKDENWKTGGYKDNTNPYPYIPINGVPEKSIRITAKTITQASSATVDASGGGSIFAYEFLPGYDGSVNPLSKADRSVIMPDNSVILPGKTIYLDGVAGLNSGIYSILPAEYAFLPGALIIESTGKTLLPGQQYTTPAGYTVTAGYVSDRAITETSPLRSGFIVRAASDVLAEGKFDTRRIVAGNAGLVEINAGAGSSQLTGSIIGEALPGYSGGTLRLSAEDLMVGPPASMAGLEGNYNLVFDIDKIKKKGLSLLQIGNDDTKNVTFAAGSILDDIPQVEMNAKDAIFLQQGVQIDALGESTGLKGTITLNADTLFGLGNTLLHASDALYLKIDNLSVSTFTGALQVDHGTLEVDSGSIYLEPALFTGARKNQGFYLSAPLLDSIGSIDNVILKSASDMVFLGDVNLAAKGELTLSSARFTVDNSPIGVPPMAHPYTVNVSAGGTLRVQNSGGVSGGDDSFNGNSIILAAETIAFGPGAAKFDTFKEVHFTSNGDTIFQGIGGLKADLAAGDMLTFSAARYLSIMTSSSVTNADGSNSLSFALSDYQIDSGLGDMIMAGNGLKGSDNMAMPGRLTVMGQNLRIDDARFDMPGSTLHFLAEQDLITENSTILATGGLFNFPVKVGSQTYDNAISLQGGQVTMESATGRFNIGASSLIDTSATNGQKGGAITLLAPTKGVGLNGVIKGDHLTIDTDALGDFGALSRSIAAGGFKQLVNLRARTGNVAIGLNDTVISNQFILTADQGAIDIAGTVDASGTVGGNVEISANKTITITGRILANGTDEGGGVSLASTSILAGTPGGVVTENGSLIDVSGSSTDKGGSVTFRAWRNAIESGSIKLRGTIQGASESIARAFRVYTNPVLSSGTTTISSISPYLTDITTNWSTLTTSWSNAGNPASVTLVPEIEFRATVTAASNGHMSISGGFDNLASLTDPNSPLHLPNGVLPGVLTFRAEGNLDLNSDIVDAPMSSYIYNSLTKKNQYVPFSDGKRDSWSLGFVAGADMTSSRSLTVRKGVGDFTVGTTENGMLIYTESGDINFATGNNIVIHALPSSGKVFNYMPGTDRYNLASYDGSINGYVGGDLILEGGIIQTAVSDISLQVKNNVAINFFVPSIGDTILYGAIRTTGRAPLVNEIPEFAQLLNNSRYSKSLKYYALERVWDFREGGSIDLDAGGAIQGAVAQPEGMGWDYAYTDFLMQNYLKVKDLQKYGAAYGVYNARTGSEKGQASHGIVTMAGGNIDIESEGIYSQVGAFGLGNLNIYSRGNMDGRFLTAHGDMNLSSLASFGSTTYDPSLNDTLIEMGSGHLIIEALGNVSLGTINNPTFTKLQKIWELTYDENTTVSLCSIMGDVVLSGKQDVFANNDYGVYLRYHLMPPSLDITAGQDIRLKSDFSNPYFLAPSAFGQFRLIAGRDINGKSASEQYPRDYNNSQFFMSAANPSAIYGYHGTTDASTEDFAQLKYSNTLPNSLHIDNFNPVFIKAGRDINNLSLSVPKQSEISAGRDIKEIGYWSQNLHKNDVSLISAGRDLVQQPYEGTNYSFYDLGINQAGYGLLFVRAGGDIDLGRTSGIQSTGNDVGGGYINNALFNNNDKDIFNRYKGTDIAVIAGYGLEQSKEELAAFFEELTEYGKEFSLLMATGKKEDESKAAQLKQEILETLITPLLEGKLTGSGNIAMTQSTIKTTSGQDDLYILAAGQIDVGTAIINTNKDTSKGLLTEGGGNINVFAESDIHVNESRVVTFFGGDIFLLSNHGDINAGRGSKTAVSPMAAGYIDVGGKLVNRFSAPAPGSGIRALTADPDGAGPISEPDQGNISLIAWEGVIDAGEAGISAANLILAATKILNSQNISFSDAGVGVPVTADAGPSLGAMTGSSTTSSTQTATQSLSQQVIDSGKQIADSVNKMAENLNVKMLVFRFDGFGDE